MEPVYPVKKEKRVDVERRAVRASCVLAIAFATSLGACSDDDRPPVSESAPLRSVPADVSTSDGDVATAAAADDVACAPRSQRECKVYYRDDAGQSHCPVSVQLCNVDGTGWLACGAYTLDENGDPRLAR